MKIAIRGHKSRGEEVIQILESLGGRNTFNYNGDYIRTAYFIGMDYSIYGFCTDSPKIGFKVYTLEEFEKKFPFKIGDKVTDHEGDVEIITGFGHIEEKLGYSLQYENGRGTATPDILKPYKEMKEERNITLTLDKAKEWYQKGGELKEIALQAFTEKELNPLPKSLEEYCRKYEFCMSTRYTNISLKYDALIKLEQLRDCWRQGWVPSKGNSGFGIRLDFYEGFRIVRLYSFSAFLSFPTEEIAKEFLECFRDLIEKAGDLI